jgi:hypothetical protein
MKPKAPRGRVDRRDSRALWVGLSLLLATGCGETLPRSTTPKLAIFPVHKTRKLPLPRGLPERLHGHTHALLAESRAFHPARREKLLKLLRRRRCTSLRCQLRYGWRKLKAARSLLLTLDKSPIGLCIVQGRIYDLRKKRKDLGARDAGGCEAEALGKTLDRVLCHLIGEQVAGHGGALRKDPPPRARPEKDCLVLAQLVRVETQVREAFAALRKPPRGRRKSSATLGQRIAEQVLALRSAYKGVGGLGVPRFAVVAVCRQGWLYERAGDALAAGEARAPWAVRRRGRAAIAAFRKAQQQSGAQQAKPFFQQARRLYGDCIAKAKLAKLEGDRYVTEAQARMKLLAP